MNPKKSRLSALRLFCVALIVFACLGFVSGDNGGMPVPSGINNMLFYVQRSLNKNTLIYQLNVNDKNELNETEPIKIFWKNYATNGSTEPLNYVQKKYAYGIESHLSDKEKKIFAFHFVSYKKQILYLAKTSDKKYHVFSYFGGKLIVVQRIYIQINGGSFWTPKVKYIEVSGTDPVKNESVSEKIVIEK